MPSGVPNAPPRSQFERAEDPDEESVGRRTESTTIDFSRTWWPTFFLLVGFMTAVLGFTVLLATNNFGTANVNWLSWPNAPELFIVGLGAACVLVGGMLLVVRAGDSDAIDFVA
jgi:uncharacterized integral membrane protein